MKGMKYAGGFLFFLSVIMMMTTCKKDNNTIRVEGTITDATTAVALEGVKVVFSSSKIADGIYNSGYQEIGTTTTDANGIFGFETPEERTSGYRFNLSKEGYFTIAKEIPADDIKPGTTYTPAFSITPIAWLKLRAYNLSPADTNDVITYSFTTGAIGCFECCDNTVHTEYGANVDTWIKCKTNGNSSITLTWDVTRNGSTESHHANIYCPAHDTTTYQIIY